MATRRRLLATLLGGLGLAGLPAPLRAQPSRVDLALVLAADCSGSVQSEHYILQQRGYAEAFRHREIERAIRSGLHGAIAVTYFQWSGYLRQAQLIPWSILRGPGDVLRFASLLEQVERVIFSGGTSPAGAIEFGMKLLEQAPAEPVRRVIDVSGDGRSNTGPAPDAARDAAAARGITVNGLPILHLEPDIDDYYERHVIGGPGAFMISARDYAAFEAAVRRKLILEIAGIGGRAGRDG